MFSDSSNNLKGNAIEVLSKFDCNFDFAFIDADKINYPIYYELSLELIRKNGIILFDNVLWGGAVVDEKNQDRNTTAIRNLNLHLLDDTRVDISLVPIGDGLTIARKK